MTHTATTKTSRFSLPPVPALILSMFSIQIGAAFAKGLFPLIGAAGTSAVRVTLAALLLILVFRVNLRTITSAQWKVILPYGLTLGIMNLAFYNSVVYLPLGLAITIEFTGPLLLALLLSRRVLDVVWVALAGVGIYFISPLANNLGTGHLGAPVSGVGVSWALLAAFMWALYILAGGAVARRITGMTGIVAGMSIAALITLPFGIAQAGLKLLEPKVLMLGLVVAVLSSALPYSLELGALRALPARVFGVMMSIEPAIGALSGLIILNEHLRTTQWAAILCVIAASIGMQLTGKRPEEKEEAPLETGMT